ncbi:MAG: hypothetical protein A2186_02265 [Candidatus Levybacteria bacterium RIFOXYA1_FULL_41_10]|nr:MAG: general secretion pathway protein G [Candidatus Levybacteria bacterium GW2011_GWC1_40_19]KKR94992.1 MAG: general secretion pathway protein G [Candidatus Levybacteria bacterium GW2011_GWA2_41_15]OGH21061.1 MAG: hypothetical protein A2695_01420 [Candidatus Levybacteria bacterium RIFCSPHIGHO2_01_FULL_40_83]OGH24536.1 MAG: hypothetical protein A3D82_02025 [Candidatus Levybacteria bacterium RIFCSPHIGHO2_02_FULL_40_29]OGH32212.1 MAG: hypothetical protein A3E70_00845 [Candidatus Levybacteria b
MNKKLIGNCSPRKAWVKWGKLSTQMRDPAEAGKIGNSDKGFTLVELLIVIAIIGVLSTLLMANFLGVRERSRDAQRKSNLRQIQSALELYRADVGSYPPTSPGLKNCSSSTALGNAPTCTTIYMKKIPSDPLGTTAYNSGNYYYAINLNGYDLVACLENSNDKDITLTPPTGAPTNCGTAPNGKYYVLTDL